MRKLIVGLFVFSIIFIGLRANASILGDVMSQAKNLKNEILRLKSSFKASVLDFSINTKLTPDLTPRISYYSGKVNQHFDVTTGIWQTDPDGISGAEIDKLTYCKKWYPYINSFTEYKIETISSWHDTGNINNYTSTRMSYKCSTSIVTPPVTIPIITPIVTPPVTTPIDTPKINIPINGGWAPWSNSGNCVDGLQTQIRSCTNPSPANGGSYCIGVNIQKINCSNEITKDCSQKRFTSALIFVTKNITESELNIYKEKLDYIKNRLPWAFNFATDGLAIMSIPKNPVILDSTGLIRSDGGIDINNTMKKFYELHGDNFDFVYIFTNASNTTGSNYHFNTKNDINGIGLGGIFDNSSNYGSQGRLMGINYMDDHLDRIDHDPTLPYKITSCYKEQKNNFSSLTVNSECGMWTILHETAHQWAVYAGDIVNDDNPSKVNIGIRNSDAHYYYGLTSPEGTRNLMGSMTWKKDPNNSVFVNYDSDTDILKYHPFTLYFMGLLPENQYDTKFKILQKNINYQATPSQSYIAMESVYKEVSVRDIINKEGPRTCQDVFNPSNIVNPDIVNTINTKPSKRILKIGTMGEDVRKLQEFLKLKEDGLFGQQTKDKVIEWQAQNGLKADGFFGNQSAQKAGLNN